MTAKERLAKEYPERAGWKSCPFEYGYLPRPDYCNGNRYYCDECWNREVSDEYIDDSKIMYLDVLRLKKMHEGRM